jgi:Icc-related predicted phosphoesterase
VSDLHYALKQFDWTLAMAPRFDVVIVAGDHLDISGHVAGSAQTLVILKYFARLKQRTRLIVSSGNHDLDSRDAAGEKAARWMERVRRLGIPTDGDCAEVDGILFTICPWWDGPAGRDRVAAQLAGDARRRHRPWAWVYHAPPDGSPTSWYHTGYEGDAFLRERIDALAPDFVVSGHIHESPFQKGGSWIDRIGRTWVFNAGRQIGPEPAHVVIDTDRREAMWFSLAGAEQVCLDQPLVRPIPELDRLPDWLRAPPDAAAG